MCEKGEKENTKNTQLKNAGNGRGSQTEGPRQKEAQMHTARKRKQGGGKSGRKHEGKEAGEEVRKLK